MNNIRKVLNPRKRKKGSQGKKGDGGGGQKESSTHPIPEGKGGDRVLLLTGYNRRII